MDEKEINIAGKKIFYRRAGEGDAVVLLHGSGEDGNVWRQQVAYLQSGFTLIVPDLPGSGNSAIIEDMTMDGLAQIILPILDREKIAEFTLIGHSMGGYIALAFAEKHPGKLKGLGLFHSTAYPDTKEKIATRKKGIEKIRQSGAFDFFQATSVNLFSQYTKEKNPEIIQQLIAGLSNFSSAAAVAYYEAMIARKDKTLVLRNSTKPVLFIAGQHDTAVPLQDVLKQCHLPSLLYIHTLRNSGHMGMLEEPDNSNLILANFLRFTSAI